MSQSSSVTAALDAAISSGGEMILPEPPCSDCVHWRPAVQRDHTGGIRGVRMCWSTAMKFDFSCFEPGAAAAPPRPRAEASGPRPQPPHEPSTKAPGKAHAH